MSKHTKGPWVIRTSGEVGQKGGKLIAVIYPIGYEEPVINRANANLISAAPDLLEALESFVSAAKNSGSIIGFAGKMLPLLQKARVAIAKAKGESE